MSTTQTLTNLIQTLMDEAHGTSWGRLLIECGFQIVPAGNDKTAWERFTDKGLRVRISNLDATWYMPDASMSGDCWSVRIEGGCSPTPATVASPDICMALLIAAHQEMTVAAGGSAPARMEALRQTRRVIGVVRKARRGTVDDGDLLYTDCAVTLAIKAMEGEAA